MSELLPCKFCKKPPGTKVGPPAMARCITPGCEGTKLAADTLDEWNIRAAPSRVSPDIADDPMDDLVYRLRYPAWSWTEVFGSNLDKEETIRDMVEAADEIERLRGDAQQTPDYRQALENARQEIVLAIAFLGRDIATKRLDITAAQLCTRLANADAAIREALAAPSSPAADGAIDPDHMNDQRMLDDMKLADNVRNAVIEECARIADNNGWEATAAQIRALALSSTQCTCGADDSDPLDHHDISCPLAISRPQREAP